MGGQGLLSIRWDGWNPAAHPVKGGASSAPHPMHRHPLYAHRVERAGVAATPTRAGSVRWCGGWECTASSAGAPVRPMHRTEPTGCRDAPHSPTGWSAPSGPPDPHHRGLHSLRTRRAVEPIASAHPRRRARAVRQGFGQPPGYCREREGRRAGGGVWDGDSAIRSREASASRSRRSRCSGERDGRIGSTMRASIVRCGLAPSPRTVASRTSASTASRQVHRRLRPVSREAERGWWRTRGRPTDGWSVGRPDVAAVSSASCP